VSPTWFDGGRGFSRARFAGANAQDRLLRTAQGAGISQVTDFTAGALPPHPRCVDADSEKGRDLRQSMSLDLFQQKHLSMSLGQLKRPEDRALERPWPLQS
jgi:hypothetical protein